MSFEKEIVGAKKVQVGRTVYVPPEGFERWSYDIQSKEEFERVDSIDMSRSTNVNTTLQLVDLDILLHTLKQLKILVIQDREMGPKHCEILASFPSTLLRHLDLSDNYLTDKGIHLLCIPGSWQRSLETLVLKCCHISIPGCVALSRRLPSLVHLNISDNWIFDDGVVEIVKNLPALKTLDVSCNYIGDRGAQNIAAYLPHIEYLNVSNNCIGSDGALAIGNLCVSLRELNISKPLLRDCEKMTIWCLRDIACNIQTLEKLTVTSCWNSEECNLNLSDIEKTIKNDNPLFRLII